MNVVKCHKFLGLFSNAFVCQVMSPQSSLITLFKDLNVAYGAVLRHFIADFGKFAEKGGSLLPSAHTTIFSLDYTQLEKMSR